MTVDNARERQEQSGVHIHLSEFGSRILLVVIGSVFTIGTLFVSSSFEDMKDTVQRVQLHDQQLKSVDRVVAANQERVTAMRLDIAALNRDLLGVEGQLNSKCAADRCRRIEEDIRNWLEKSKAGIEFEGGNGAAIGAKAPKLQQRRYIR